MVLSSGKRISLLIVLFAHLNYANNGSELTIGFVGDVMLGRLVSEVLLKNSDYTYPWGNLLPLLKSTDFIIANLETTLALGGTKAVKVFNFKSHPANVEALLQANIQVVNLANNHILDFGQQGLVEILATLDEVGIKHTGAGLTLQQAQTPALINKKGIRCVSLVLLIMNHLVGN